MKKTKFFALAALAFVGVLGFTSCSEDEEEAVAIVSASITPNGSAKEYALIASTDFKLENTNDSVDYDVTDAALKEAVLKVTPTLNGVVTVNGSEVGETGVVVDATSPVTVVVTGATGKAVSYTMNVVKALTGVDGVVKKGSAYAGMPSNVVWMDVTAFNGKFYAIAISTEVGESTVEKYELYTSIDALNWTKVDYTVDGEAAIIGGEGARLAVLNDKLIVFGGLRSLGTSIYGDAPEVTQGWTGPAPVANFHVWESADGKSFTTISDIKIMRGETDYTAAASIYANPYANVSVYKNKLVVSGGMSISYGMIQPSRCLMTTEDCKNWTVITALDADGASLRLPDSGSAFYELNGKAYLAGGFNNFVSAGYVLSSVYSSEDLETWTLETPEESTTLPAVFQAKAVSNGKVAYIFSGETDAHELVSTVYATTDGVNFTPVEATNYAGTRMAAGVAMGDIAWIFGGYNTASSGYYGAVAETDTWSTDTWNVQMK